MEIFRKKLMKKTKCFFLLLVLILLTSCGGYSQPAAVNGGTSGAAVDSKNESESVSGAAVNDKKQLPSIHDQICTIVRNEEIWLREDTRVEENEENDDGVTINGPYYSVMDLDQDGYLEIVVSSEEKQNGPSFYEVTEDEKLQKWTAEGDLPREESFLQIFEGTSKADCYYDPSRGQYHYIVKDTLFVSQDDADAAWLDMVPEGSGVSFRKIGRHTFDARKDNKFHYFNADGVECQESDITKGFSGMQKKSMYFSKMPISKREAVEVWGWGLERASWKSFILRDVYQSDREKRLTDEFLHQFTFISISMDKYISALGERGEEDEIRYAATDLDNDQLVEVIIENRKTKKWCIYESVSEEDGFEERKWNTKNKKITDYTDKIPEESWQTYNVYTSSTGMIKPSYELIKDNLRESWLRFADHNKLP